MIYNIFNTHCIICYTRSFNYIVVLQCENQMGFTITSFDKCFPQIGTAVEKTLR